MQDRDTSKPRKWSGIWVRLSVVGAMVWLFFGLSEVLEYDTTVRGKAELGSYVVLGAVLIMFMGLGIQWAIDYLQSRSRDLED